MGRYLWGFWQVMSAVAHQGTLNASHCWCDVKSFYSCDCVGNCFSWIWTPNSIAPHECWTTRQHQSTNTIFCSWLNSISRPWSSLSGTSITLEHTNTRQDPESRVIGPSQRPLPDNTRHSQETTMSPARFEPAIPLSERPQTYNLDPRPPGSANTVDLNMKARDDCNFRCRAIVTLPSVLHWYYAVLLCGTSGY